ncbi:9548_t:CDS:2 [Entrophospora sp. SA101]|nr:9548_t:CDS:2 [Entrophospora sp. SA101]CAJ0878608.1 17403_t:CDS:2 [Entrophospora sp. SA101]
MANPIQIPIGLNLNQEEQEVFYRLNRRERLRFNALQDNNAKLVYIQALVDRENSDREKSDFEQKIKHMINGELSQK